MQEDDSGISFQLNDKIVAKVVDDISRRHHEIIDEWCKAFLAELYEEGVDIKPGCFVVHEMQQGFYKQYWFTRKQDVTRYKAEDLPQDRDSLIEIIRELQYLLEKQSLSDKDKDH